MSCVPAIEVGGGATSRKRIFLAFGMAAIVVAAVGIVVLKWTNPTPGETPPVKQNALDSTGSNAIESIARSKPVPAPDPWAGLKAGKVALEKQGDGRLIYAVGTVRNTSDHQRFGVKVELDVLDEQGEKLGSATDYTQVMEPGKEWKFKAMVTDRKAASAKLVKISEQN